MISPRLIEGATVGAKRAGIHVLRAASELVAAAVAFAEEIGDALNANDDDGMERIPVEAPEED